MPLSQCQIKHGTAVVTKQNILQASSKQYDPLVTTCLITVHAKLLNQELWKKRVSWDEPLDADFNSEWCQVATDIEEAAKIVMTHRYSVMSNNQCVYLHVFGDASMKAYDVVAYLLSAEQDDFMMAKSHVSLLKDNTLPRLELRAAVMAAHLATFIVSTLHIQLRDAIVRMWSDSRYTGSPATNNSDPLLPTASKKFAPCFSLLHGDTATQLTMLQTY